MHYSGSSKIWVISLANAAARREAFAATAPPTMGWDFFDAHTGAYDGLVYDDDVCRRRLLRSLWPGELGCYSSHAALWRWLLASECEQMVVLEDDVIVDWPLLSELLARNLPALGIHYLRLFTKVPFRWRYVATPFLDNYHHLLRITGFALGTQGYLISREGARRLLASGERIQMPVDVYMDSVWKHEVMNLALYPFPLVERFEPSSIGDARLAGHAGQGWAGLRMRICRKLGIWASVYGPDPAAAHALRERLRG
jgi:glycosyl transferase, family 25